MVDVLLMGQILHGDCVEVLASLPAASVDLVFADPPFNISLPGYDGYSDDLTPAQYVAWVSKWLDGCDRVLTATGSIFILISDEFAAEMAIELKKRFTMRNWLCWFFGFGQQTSKKFARTKQHLLYFVKNGKQFTFNADAVKVPSLRQLKYGDKRAASGGKVPEDVWDMKIGDEDIDIWKISRLCGTFSQRIKGEDGSAHPCQLPEELLERVIKVASNPGEVVLDPFCGTGTTAFVANKLGRDFITMDQSIKYCQVAAKRIFGHDNGYAEFTKPADDQMQMFGAI